MDCVYIVLHNGIVLRAKKGPGPLEPRPRLVTRHAPGR